MYIMLCCIVVKHKPLPQNYDSSSNARSGLLANLKGACNKLGVWKMSQFLGPSLPL